MAGKKHIHIVGAGVAGLGIGWRLAKAGYAVDIYDKGMAGHGASWAAAGMLAAILESEPGEEKLLPFLLESQKHWPGFAKELQQETGLSVGYVESGTLFAARERDDVGILRQRHAYLQKHGVNLEWLDRTQLLAREPCLSPRAYGALLSANDHVADNRALVTALLAACKKAGVQIHEHAPVEEILIEDGRAAGFLCKGEKIFSEQIILCMGAWGGCIKGVPQMHLPPVFPLKGQMLALQMDAAKPLLRHVLWTPRVYLVPREDGRLIIGATMEDRGFEEQARAGSVLHLLYEAFEILPGIEELPLVESWTGLRPTSRDDAPILGPSGIKGLTYATGQHRHGILLTPLIAAVISDYIQGGELSALAQPFTMARFG
ncbi:MAG TPA: glycine oxidase ThiO [Alphaproteobacteria bacterium]|nr:glycine oxidase ThiO [Alphaproteobacteria bacterium]